MVRSSAWSAARRAVAAHRGRGCAYRLTLLDQAERLVEHGRTEEAAPGNADVRTTFEHLSATPRPEWLDVLSAGTTAD